MKKLALSLVLISMVNVSAHTPAERRSKKCACPVSRFIKSPQGIAVGVVAAVGTLYLIRSLIKAQLEVTNSKNKEIALGAYSKELEGLKAQFDEFSTKLKHRFVYNGQTELEVGATFEAFAKELEKAGVQLPEAAQSSLIVYLDKILYPISKYLVDPATNKVINPAVALLARVLKPVTNLLPSHN